jgi:peptidoglycan-associated lipoprotein
MKLKLFGLFVLIIAGAFILSGCGCFMQAAKGEAAPPAPPGAKTTAPEAKKEARVQPPAQGSQAATMLKDINFDFDKYNIRQEDANILKKDAEWLSSNRKARVKIEGYCDERGTVEYNLVLGQKRADATKNYFVSLGIDPKTLETVSYGKERPLDPAHNEAAWAKNRRAHLVPLK